MSTPRIGVVTVTYNSGRYLDAFFRSSFAQDLADWRMYAIDNASQDDSAARLGRAAAHDDRVVPIINARNVGVAEGNNQGTLRALQDGCEWVLLLNNDTTFPQDFFSQLLRACSTQGWPVVVPKIHFDEPAGHLWYAGGGFNPRRGHTGYHEGIGEPDRGQFDTVKTVDYAPTCAMLVHRSVFERVGLMDEAYFVYFDDTDFCWRLKLAGVPIGYWAATSLVHKVGGSTGGTASPFTARMTARNRLYYLRKHFGIASARLWTGVFLLYYVVRYLVLRRDTACFSASIEGTRAYRSLTPRVPTLPASS
jgi:hypothetical protein